MGLLTIEAFVLFMLLDLLLVRWPFDKVYARLVESPRRRVKRQPEAYRRHVIEEIVGAVTIATRFYYRRRRDCLPKSLTLCRLLRSRAIPAEFCLGVKKYPFSAHAWVEWEGELIDDWPQRVGTYRVLTRLGPPAQP